MAKIKQTLNSGLSLEKQLNIELRNLKEKINQGHELERVIWLPGKKILNPEGKFLEGEVKGHVVYIYSENDPVLTLKHEFVDYLLSQDKKPLMDLVAKLLGHIVYGQYQNSEKLADALARLL